MIPFLKVGGRFLPQKLNDCEIAESKNALDLLNSKINEIHIFKLPKIEDKRFIIEIEKLKQTDKKYPRNVGIPLKNPL